ncbi:MULTISPECIES: glutamyl-tRNA reductase [Cysteiniphilum]|uniref:Glutamyl-tRNA reductase n=1 Tax=Cysteiniphilum litorale TaxID=2056700 RepID=A0A8J2Z726_9GAMM|nr:MULTISPECIES: glutamyl-tRNA reductase [Cysteiniphilum]GGG08580.1 glutamyl-tRNA reductase [Cysteiniphilum litorale]
MTLVSLAIDYKKASLDVRGAFTLDNERLGQHLKTLKEQHGVEQCLILSTCNRTEIYAVISELKHLDHVINWWQQSAKRNDLDLKNFLIVRQGTHVAHHLMRLSCGLESMVLGEPQILGQIKYAYAEALANNTLGGDLNRLMQKVFSVAKRVRFHTNIGQCPVSVAFSAVTLAKQSLSHFEDKTILVIGAGSTAMLVTKHLASLTPKRLIIVNRTLEKAQQLATEHHAEAFSLSVLSGLAEQADIIVSAVNSRELILTADMLTNTNPKTLIDLSVPRVTDPLFDQMDNITIYCVDDIQGLIQNNKTLREKAALRAEKWIEKGLDDYINQEKAILSDNTIKAMRNQTKDMIDDELNRCLKRLENGEDPKMVLARFAHNVKNKWLHTPSVSLRNAAVEGRNDMLNLAEEIFGLNTGL